MLMGSFNSIKNTPRDKANTAAASRYLQKIVATFIRDPTNGLRNAYKWPTYNPNTKSLVELFANNTIGATLTSSVEFDAVCSNPPPLSWLAVAAPAPVCHQ